MKKRILSLALAVLMLLCVVPFSTYASAAESSAYKQCYNAIVSGLKQCKSLIDIEKYGFTMEVIEPMYEEIRWNEPMLFHITGWFTAYHYVDTGKITELEPEYSMDAANYNVAVDFVNQEIEKILDSMPYGLPKIEQALYLHDYICANYEYDLSYTYYDIYNLLARKTAVCMGYALLYDELLTRIGIKNTSVYSPYDSINHIWNAIELDGVWYHVDTTWDDPTDDLFGRALHSYYLQCEYCSRSMHENCIFECDVRCTDERYESMTWRDSNYPFAFIDGSVYGLYNNEIYEVDLQTDSRRFVKTAFTDYWYATDGSYIGRYSGFGGYGDWVYYNTPTAIIGYNPKTGEEKNIYTAPYGRILGLYVSSNNIYLYLSETGYYDDGIAYRIELDLVEKPVGGDANGDGKLDTFDYIYVKRAYFGTLVISDSDRARADVNKDGELNQFDYVLVKRAYLGTYTFR